MTKKTLNRAFKVCATCSLWGGSRTPRPGGYAVFEDPQKAKCYRTGPNSIIETPAMQSCAQWDLWAPLK